MVDRVNASPAAGLDRVSAARSLAPSAPAARAADPAPVAAPEPVGAGSTLQALASELAAKPPVDQERVARFKAAIASGSYPISPENIADRLIAFGFDRTPHDPS